MFLSIIISVVVLQEYLPKFAEAIWQLLVSDSTEKIAKHDIVSTSVLPGSQYSAAYVIIFLALA